MISITIILLVVTIFMIVTTFKLSQHVKMSSEIEKISDEIRRVNETLDTMKTLNLEKDILSRIDGSMFLPKHELIEVLKSMSNLEEGSIIELPVIMRTGVKYSHKQILAHPNDVKFIRDCMQSMPNGRYSIVLYPTLSATGDIVLGYTNLIALPKLIYLRGEGYEKEWFNSTKQYRVKYCEEDNGIYVLEDISSTSPKVDKPKDKRFMRDYLLFLYTDRVKPNLTEEEIIEFENSDLYRTIKLLKEGTLAISFTMNSLEFDRFIQKLTDEFHSRFREQLK